MLVLETTQFPNYSYADTIRGMELLRVFVKITKDDKWQLAALSVDARVESLEEYGGILLVEAMKHPSVIAAAKREAEKRVAAREPKKSRKSK